MGAALGPIGLAFSAGSSIMSGMGAQAADDYQAQRLERAAEYGKVAATQTSAQGLEKLNITLGNIDAVRAAGNVDPSSPTTAAVKGRTSYLAQRDTDIKVDNILAQASQNESDANYLQSAGSFAMMQGFVGAGAKGLNYWGSTV